MGYEQGELLSCIDNGQLPAMLAEQLESSYSHLFYDGCMIAEVRDYRRSFLHNRAEIHHVLLKPTTQVRSCYQKYCIKIKVTCNNVSNKNNDITHDNIT